jgi:23S rRNA (pseudouridine1915-N3)-methyltransferase
MLRHTIAAVGRARRGPVAALFVDYVRRTPWPIRLIEIHAAARDPAASARDEHAQLLTAIPSGAGVVALDGSGRDLSSEDLARRLADWRRDGMREVAWLIGGADGLSDDLRQRADLMLAFGRQTWPHLLVRVMLAEQLYRASTILAGHPYHRA